MTTSDQHAGAAGRARALMLRTALRRRRAAALTTLAAISLGVAGCGGSGGGSPASTPAQSKPTQLYTVTLSGRAEPRAGATAGHGFAIIAFHGPKMVCWRFAHLHGFTTATHAAIYAGTAHENGNVAIALTGPPALHHRGCIATTAQASARITHAPGAFYVNVFAAQFPRGAVRGQL